MKLKQARKLLNLRQIDIFNELKIPISTIQKWERGVNHPPQYVINLIIVYLFTLEQINERGTLWEAGGKEYTDFIGLLNDIDEKDIKSFCLMADGEKIKTFTIPFLP